MFCHCCNKEKCTFSWYKVLRIFTILAMISVTTFAIIKFWDEILDGAASLKEKVSDIFNR